MKIRASIAFYNIF